jgi:CheY-like chemotaxis protein
LPEPRTFRFKGKLVSTILAIDDDEIFQILVKRIFEPMGAQIVSAHTSDEGLALAQTVQPSVILLDIRLPGKIGDGWMVAKLIKQDENLRHVPLIMVSASGGGMGLHAPDDVHYEGYFSKPFKVESFRDHIMRLLL